MRVSNRCWVLGEVAVGFWGRVGLIWERSPGEGAEREEGRKEGAKNLLHKICSPLPDQSVLSEGAQVAGGDHIYGVPMLPVHPAGGNGTGTSPPSHWDTKQGTWGWA